MNKYKSEFNLGREPNEEEENYNISANYVFDITELDDTKYFLSPVEAYAFLAHGMENVKSIVLNKNDKPLIVFGKNKEATPYSMYQQISSMDSQFKDVYEIEYAEKKAAGQEVFNPFSAKSGNMNWISVAKRRKNAIKNTIRRALPTFEERFNFIKGRGRLGGWKGATPTPETIEKVMKTGKLRSRKTRKIRR